MDPELQALLAKAAQATPGAGAPPQPDGLSLQAMLEQAARPTPGAGNEHMPGDLELQALLPKELQGANTSLPPTPAQPPRPPVNPDANKKYGDELPASERLRITANVNKMAAQGAPDSDIEQYLTEVEGLSKRADLGTDERAMGGPLQTALGGLTLGVAPYLEGSTFATLEKANDALTGQDHGSWTDEYRKYRDLGKDLDTGFASAHPVWHGLEKTAASIPPSVLLAEMVPARWIGQGFVNKATASGIGGLLMQSEENAANAGGGPAARFNAVLHENPLEGFVAGVGGAALAPAARGLKNIFSPNVADAAAEQLGSVAGSDLGDNAADKMTQRAQEFVAAGKPARVFDLAGQGLVDRTSAAQTFPGPGKAEITNALKARNAQEGERVLADLQQHTGASPDNAYLTGEQLQAAQAARAKPLYDAAVSQPVSPSVAEEVQRLRSVFPEIDKAFGKSAFLRARDEAIGAGPAPAVSAQQVAANASLANAVRLNPGMPPEKISFIAKQLGADPASLEQDASAMTVGDIHYAKRALDDMLDPKFQSANSIPPREAFQANTAFRRLLARVEQEVPAYRVARTTYKGDAEAREALELGQSIMDPFNVRSPEELQATVAAMSPSEQALFKQGAYDAIRRRAGDVNDSRSIANTLFGTGNKRTALATMFDGPDDPEYDAFLQKLGMERTMRGNASDVLVKSQTAGLQQQIKDMTGGVTAGDAMSAPFSLRRMGRTVIRKLGNGVTRENTQNIVNEFARMANVEVGSPEFDAVMRALRRLPLQAAQRDAVNLGVASAAGGLPAPSFPAPAASR